MALFNKTVFVTGGSRGIGKACVYKFASLGYNVAFSYNKSYEKAVDIANDLKSSANILPIKCDGANNLQTKLAVDEIITKFGGIDVLINNIGISEQKLFTDITEKDWDNMFDVNVKSCYNSCVYVLPQMINKKSGKIINISSMWAITGASCEVHYSASKAAIIGFTKALAKEVGPSGVTVNAISPGVIDTEMNACFDEETLQALKNDTPLGKIGKAENIADMAAFLASQQAEFITGQNISVDGGMVI